MQRGETVDLREFFTNAEPEAAGAHQHQSNAELARVVRAATALQARRETVTAVRCLKGAGCGGFLSVRLQDIPPVIFWHCSHCPAGGKILNWPHTPWDLSHLSKTSDGDHMGPVCEIPLSREQYESLLDLKGCDEAFQKIIFAAVPRRKGVVLRGDLPDFLYLLERCIERSASPGTGRQSQVLSQICASLDSTIRKLERRRAEREPPWGFGGALDDMELPGWLPPDLADRLRRALEDGQFGNIEELNDQLALTVEAYNRSPSAEFAGLSPYQISNLLTADWDGDGALSLNPDLSVEKISGCLYYRCTRRLLHKVDRRGGLPTTARGNLTRRVVRELISECDISSLPEDLQLNEQDVAQIHIPRVICQLGGLLRRRGRKFHLTKRGRRLLEPRRAGELYRHLFDTFFRKFNLAYLDGSVENHALQDTVAFTLYALSRQQSGWQSIQTLAPRILLPAAFEAALDFGEEQPAWQAYTRVLLPMYYFGLLEFRMVKKEGHHDRQFRPSSLFRSFIHVSL